MKDNIIAAIDIGTTKVCTTIAHIDGDELEIIGVGSHPSYGLKKGSVVNIDKTVHSIRSSVEEAKLMSGIENFDIATIGIAGNHIYSFNSSGVIPVKGSEITQDEVNQVIEAAKAVLIPSDREVLHVIPQEFRVDKTSGIKDPIGMSGKRLEAHVHIVTGMVTSIENLVKCVNQAGINTDKIILQPIASSRSVLTLEEKELGVILVDIGGGTTDIAVWLDGSLIHSQIIPVGGNHFTNDLAVALKIPHTEAERIKINHGAVLREMVNQSSNITVQGLTGIKSREIPIGVIAEVLEARAEELFGIISNIIKERNLQDKIMGGVVITGGGALINGLTELAEFTLEKPVKVGYPTAFGGMTTVMENPKFSTVLGLLLESNQGSADRSKNRHMNGDILNRLGDSIKGVFREIF